MSLAMMIFIPIACAFGLLYWSEQLSEEYIVLRLAFQLMFIPLIWVSVHLAIIDASIIYSSNTDLITLLGQLVEYLGYLFFFVGAYIAWKLLEAVWIKIQSKRAEKKEEMYD